MKEDQGGRQLAQYQANTAGLRVESNKGGRREVKKGWGGGDLNEGEGIASQQFEAEGGRLTGEESL